MRKRILVVAHDRPLRETRVSLLMSEGYEVASVESDEDALLLLESKSYDVILLGWNSQLPKTGLDRRLRELYPKLLTLKIEIGGERRSRDASRVVDFMPAHVLQVLKEMLSAEVELTPVTLPTDHSASA